ncbi:MAG: hypothetical protein AABW84_02170 [Nanoarchaeota archaeon]
MVVTIQRQTYSVKPNNYNYLNESDKSIVDKLEDFEAPWLEEKLLSSGVFDSQEEYNQAFSEFKKYIALIGLVGGGLGMTSKKVDAVWHQFILFTKEYHEFSDEVLGRYIHHSPETSLTKGSKSSVPKFIDSYIALYGDIPNIWDIKSSTYDCEGCTYPEMDCKDGD